METPGSGSLVVPSRTVPETVDCASTDGTAIAINRSESNALFIFIMSPVNERPTSFIRVRAK